MGRTHRCKAASESTVVSDMRRIASLAEVPRLARRLLEYPHLALMGSSKPPLVLPCADAPSLLARTKGSSYQECILHLLLSPMVLMSSENKRPSAACVYRIISGK